MHRWAFGEKQEHQGMNNQEAGTLGPPETTAPGAAKSSDGRRQPTVPRGGKRTAHNGVKKFFLRSFSYRHSAMEEEGYRERGGFGPLLHERPDQRREEGGE